MDGLTLSFMQEIKTYFENTIEEILEKKIEQLSPKELKTEREWMKQKEVCEQLNISYNTLQKWIVLGLKISQVEGITLINREEINRFLRNHEF